jgi:hypothetical protein
MKTYKIEISEEQRLILLKAVQDSEDPCVFNLLKSHLIVDLTNLPADDATDPGQLWAFADE